LHRIFFRLLDHQPDLYCIYKFYDFTDHDTITIPSSNNPNFDDRAQYPIQMDADLDRYLKQSQLTIFVFDDRDQKDDRYVARADIPLIPLAHDNQIRGTFDMHNDRGETNGTMDVTFKWTYSYLPPSASTRTPSQRAKSIPTNQREPLALLPDESISGHKTIAEKQREMNVRLTPQDVLGSDSDQRPKPGRMKREKEIGLLGVSFFLLKIYQGIVQAYLQRVSHDQYVMEIKIINHDDHQLRVQTVNEVK
jgi:hypothetical protein